MKSDSEIAATKLAARIRGQLKRAAHTPSAKRKGAIKGLTERSRGFAVEALGTSVYVEHIDPNSRLSPTSDRPREDRIAKLVSYQSTLAEHGIVSTLQRNDATSVPPKLVIGPQ